MKGKGRNLLILLGVLSVFAAGCGGSGTSVWDPGVDILPVITDTTPPIVIYVNPANGATNVPLNTIITATFNEVMDPATIISPATTFRVTRPNLTVVPGTVSYSGTTAVFTPSSTLSDTMLYTATITTAAQDDIGNALASNYVWTFTTGATLDETAPWITFTDPINAATGVPIDQKVAANFNEVMDPTTLDTNSFTLMGPNSLILPVKGKVAYAGTTAVFTPIDSLGADTNLAAGVYIALIAPWVTDLAGNAIVSGPVPNPWNFTVGSTPDNTAPIITFTDPVDDVAGDTPVAINHAVSATFSEPMNPTTIIAGVTFIVNDTLNGDTILGTVSFVTNADTTIATFTPDSNLLPSREYTATITNLVEDLDGDTLVVPQTLPVPDPWYFWTGTDTEITQGAIDLGLAGSYGIMARSSLSNTGPSVINGDVALMATPSSMTGFPPGIVNGVMHFNDSVATATYLDLLDAYNFAWALGVDDSPGTVDLGGYTPAGSTLPAGTFPPGVYFSGSAMNVNTPLTLDAGGNANAVWVFQVTSDLTTVIGTPGGNVLLANGAQAKNVFWVVINDATVGDYTTFNGNILAGNSITGVVGATINGRLLSGALGAGSVVLDSNTVNVPAP